MAKRIISRAVTGGAPATGRNPNVPVTPKEIAASAIDAARAAMKTPAEAYALAA